MTGCGFSLVVRETNHNAVREELGLAGRQTPAIVINIQHSQIYIYNYNQTISVPKQYITTRKRLLGPHLYADLRHTAFFIHVYVQQNCDYQFVTVSCYFLSTLYYCCLYLYTCTHLAMVKALALSERLELRKGRLTTRSEMKRTCLNICLCQGSICKPRRNQLMLKLCVNQRLVESSFLVCKLISEFKRTKNGRSLRPLSHVAYTPVSAFWLANRSTA